MQDFVERERNFTRDVSHELRSAITVIKMASELLGTSSTDAQAPLLDKINRASKDMQELTEFFLILAREESLETRQSSILVNDIVSAEADKLSLMSAQKDVPIIIEHEAQCRVKAPEKVLSVLIGNVLRNSLLYTEAGKVTVSISAQRLCVLDTGIGISQEKLATIFDCFERGEGHSQDGFGIGLSIVKRLCNKFHWSLDLASEKHKGTNISIAFSP
ncbi:MAG: HAMP domain-containing sensor histidine kinase [Pseudomonadota bacterium]